MKKLILFVILWFLSSAGIYQKVESVPEMIVQKDTIKKVDTTKKTNPKRIFELSKLDTTSNLSQMRKNLKTINYQQKQLDSLLIKKKIK